MWRIYINRTVISLFVWIYFMSFPVFSAGPKPVLIGATVSLEGKYKEPSSMIQGGLRLWEKEVNQRGGLLGRPVKLIFYNDKSRKDRVGPLYEKLIMEDKVDMILSPYGTPLTLKASQVTERHGYVMLASAAAGEKVWEREYQYIFGVYAIADRYFIGLLDLMARNGLKSLGIIFENTSFNTSIAKGVRKWALRFGLKVEYYQGFNDPGKDLPKLLTQISSKNVDGLIFSGYPPECYQFISLMKKANYRPKTLSFTIVPVHPDFAKKVGSFAEGIFAPSQWEPDERIPFPGTTKFINDFKAFTKKMPSYHAGSAYSACQILEKTVKHTRSLNNKAIRDYIFSLDTVTVIGRFKVDHTGKQVGHNPILIQWQNGKKEIVYPRKMQTASPRF
jgi:branched-chain amino acid transport system substrate-binding protein